MPENEPAPGGRTTGQRLDRLEDLAAKRGETLTVLAAFNDLVVKPLVEQVKDLEDAKAKTDEELAGFKGALRMAVIVGSVLAFLITTGLAILAVILT